MAVKCVLTDLVEEFVAFIEDEHLKVLHGEGLLSGQVQDTAWGSYNDVRCLVALEKLYLGANGLATIDDLSTDIFHELCEPLELCLNLICELTGVAYNEGRAWLRVVTNALEDGDHEDCSLTHS